MEHLPWDYGVEFHQEGQKKEVAFQPLPMADIMDSVKVVQNETGKVQSKEDANQESCPTFGPHPNTQAVINLDFNKSRAFSLQAHPGECYFGKRTSGQIYWFDL